MLGDNEMRLTFSDGTTYYGEIKAGLPHGRGTLHYPDGKKFVGSFKDGKKHGLGTTIFTDGTIDNGEWVDDRKREPAKALSPAAATKASSKSTATHAVTMAAWLAIIVLGYYSVNLILPGESNNTPTPSQVETQTNLTYQQQNIQAIPMPPAEEPASEPTDTLYNRIRDALINAETDLNIASFPEHASSEEVFALVRMVVMDNPEILYYEGCTYRTDGYLQFNYKYDSETTHAHLQQVRRKAEQIISTVIIPGMSDFEKILEIHDYIVENASYDTDIHLVGEVPPESHSAYGVLIRGTGVCESYAKALKLLLDRLNMESILVSGIADGEAHAWNMVKIGGDYYHVDTTWNDPVMKDGTDVLRHDYFNITDAEISATHTWDRHAYPACTATTYNYHHYYGQIAHSYTDFYATIKEAILNREESLELKILDYNPTTYDVSTTVNKVLKDNPGLIRGSLSWNHIPVKNEKIGVIQINFKY